jgi:hypothetical protein
MIFYPGLPLELLLLIIIKGVVIFINPGKH